MPEQLRYSPEQGEDEQYSSRVLLHLERHGDKAGEVLSEKGKAELFEKGKAREHIEPTAVAMGSKLERTRHSAGLDMAGALHTDEYTGEETLEELTHKLDADMKYGSKIGTISKLGFSFDTPELRDAAVGAVKQGRYLEFVVNESDAKAKELKDSGATYSRSAADIATVLERYVKVAGNFDKLMQDPEKQEEYGKILERFLGSHAGVVDAFLVKVVEKLHGVEARDELVKKMPGGFNTAEGYDITIDTIPGETDPRVHLKFTRENDDPEKAIEIDETISLDTLHEIIEERQ